MLGKLCLFILALCSLSLNGRADQYIPLEDSTSSANIDVINRSMNSLYSTKMDLRPQDVIPVKANTYSLGSANYPFKNLFLSGGVAITTFSSAGSTGNQSITGIGFKPRLVILAYSRNSGADDGNTAIGWFTETAQSSAISFGILGAESYTKENDPSVVLQIYDKDGTVKMTISRVSMDDDGFTLNYGYATAGYTGKTISCLAIQ